MIQRSVISSSWLIISHAAAELSTPCIFTIRPSCFTHIHSQQCSSYIHCVYWHWPVLWRWSRLDSWLFVEEIKASLKGVKLIWQWGLTHDRGSSCLSSVSRTLDSAVSGTLGSAGSGGLGVQSPGHWATQSLAHWALQALGHWAAEAVDDIESPEDHVSFCGLHRTL